jgi:hypothetical protein
MKSLKSKAAHSKNQIALRARQWNLNGEDSDERFQFCCDMQGLTAVGVEVWIDGKRFAPRCAVDLLTLLYSAHEPLNGGSSGEALFSCGCGHVGCAGISDNVSVIQEPSDILWSCPYPINFDTQLDISAQKEVLNFRFNRHEMVTQQGLLLNSIRHIASGREAQCRIPIYEESVSELMDKGFIFKGASA